MKYDDVLTPELKQKIRLDYKNSNLSYVEIGNKYNIKSKSYLQKLLNPVKKSSSEIRKLAREKYPEKFKLTEQAKNKIRMARLKYMKEHPNDTAWRKRNIPSYPEQCFIKFLQENKLDQKYLIEREYSVFPYFIDFAFPDIKLAVEIDGSQHLLECRKKKDFEKDTLLKNLGWSIVRISENLVKTDWNLLLNIISKYLNGFIGSERVGILKIPKSKKKPERDQNGKTVKQKEAYLNLRKIKDRPSKKELNKLILTNTFTKIGEMYNVSDNTIRKWCKSYNLPYRKKDLKLQQFESA